ncbi:MAG: flagellar protein [Parvibaculum sp.]|uniref:flagellin N-terminal helical domain-containing protein n=1 Tax=Parvibaculum sp. TaxID=2024848 RepID=UPI0025F4AE89|nr:flagellin [Parvibaculum sp.]MCE9650701.1 flagellar protein [Parvibaculum sp.]
MSGITLSNAVRQNLLTLQDTASMMSETQNRLATGNKVNTAVDNANSYFTAKGLNDRASDLSTLQDNMSLAVQTLNAASQGIDSITKLVSQAKSIANQALQTTVTAATASSAVVATDYSTAANSGLTLTFKIGDNASTSVTLTQDVTSAGVLKTALSGKVSGLTVSTSGGQIKFSVASGVNFKVSGTAVGTAIASNISTSNGANRAKFQTQYNDLLSQIDQLSKDASFNGVNLLTSGTTLTVNFNEKQTSKLDIAGVKLDAAGLSLTSVSNWDAADSNVATSVASLDKATTTLRNQSSTFGSNLAVVQNRQTFTTNLINTLGQGAAGLTLADTNQEGANLLALQTRQSLATTALSLSNQAQSSILSILR